MATFNSAAFFAAKARNVKASVKDKDGYSVRLTGLVSDASPDGLAKHCLAQRDKDGKVAASVKCAFPPVELPNGRLAQSGDLSRTDAAVFCRFVAGAKDAEAVKDTDADAGRNGTGRVPARS